MIPDSIGTVVAFLLLIAPGFVWDRCAARYVPEQKETALREISRIVLASLTASAVSTAALAWMWIPVLRSADNELAVLGTSAVTSLLACGLVMLFAWWRLRGPARMSADSVLHQAFETWIDHETADGMFVAVTLEDGVVWRGRYGAVDTGAEDLQPLLALRAPLSRRKPDDEAFSRYKGEQLVLLPLQRIVSMRVVATSPALRSEGPG